MMLCACGHSLSLHGRRGYGSCRQGRGGVLAHAVAVARVGVAYGATQQQIRDGIERVREIAPCSCKRFRKGIAGDSPPTKAVLTLDRSLEEK